MNLHFDIRDSYIFERMSGLQRVEGRCLSADAHLALLGVNYSGNGILGLRKIKKQREIAASFHIVGYNMALFYMDERRMIFAHDGGLDFANALF